LMLRLMFWWVGFCGWSWFLLTRFWFFQQMGLSLLFGFALPLSLVLLGSWWRLVCSNHDLVIGLMILGGGCGSLHGECCRSLHPYCVDLDFWFLSDLLRSAVLLIVASPPPCLWSWDCCCLISDVMARNGSVFVVFLYSKLSVRGFLPCWRLIRSPFHTSANAHSSLFLLFGFAPVCGFAG
jgi:hypothetical protein